MATFWWPLTILTSIAFSQTTAPSGCSANHAFVYLESSLGAYTSETIVSERVNYAPFSYATTIPRRKLVPFAENELMNTTMNNPCDMSTWSTPPAYYDNAVVLLRYDAQFASICTPQEWTLNLEAHNPNIQAVLIANSGDLWSVYPLPGESSLPQPTTPTRMISQNSAINILSFMGDITNANDIMYASIGCFDGHHISSIICMVDQSEYGENVVFDGEFQMQAETYVNDHPVWYKEGMNNVWIDYYLWLTVDESASVYAWKWVIGTDFEDDSSIQAECLPPNGENVDDPSQCGLHWYRNGVPINGLSSELGVCDLGDTYVCVDSGSLWFDTYFAGRYRQVHDGVSVWLSDSTVFDAFIGVQYVNKSFARGMSFVFSYAANGGTYAFCPIDESDPSNRLKPWDCNTDWYVVGFDTSTNKYTWFNDPLMDVDECSHPQQSTVAPVPIAYPKYLCFMDPTYRYSHYQTYYGIYVLDNSTKYDDRFVYKHQTSANNNNKQWSILWYEEKDSWILNEEIPQETFTTHFGGICRDNIDTPDQCSKCWEFYQGITDENNCNVRLTAIATNVESDCMTQRTDDIVNYRHEQSLCFTDDTYNGKWKLESRALYNGRHFWYLQHGVTGDVLHYMFYDHEWRYWIIDGDLGADSADKLYCLHWDEFEPFNCYEWFTVDGQIVDMDSDCTFNPTKSPTPYPTPGAIECAEYSKYVHAESTAFPHQILESSESNIAPFKSSTFYHVRLVLFEEMTHNTGNPCNSTTWTKPANYYDNAVVLVKYSPFYASLCSYQKITLNLEKYADVVAVLVGNDRDITHTYPLTGNDNLEAPLIPTRMISQMATDALITTLNLDLYPVWISFGCFDDAIDYPSTICLVDTSVFGDYVYLDGEYQRQETEVNNHPIWRKQGHIGLWHDLFMFFDGAERTWLIGTDYRSKNSVIAKCDLNGEYITDPSMCDHDWSINGVLVSNISTQGTTCALGDNYVCVVSTSNGFFESYFDGRYRQIHEGVPLWLLESQYLDAHIRIAQITWAAMFGDAVQYVFAFMVNQTDIYAFCLIGEQRPNQQEALSPWQCNKDWYVIDYDSQNNGYKWIIDMAFDIDECTHPNLTTPTPQIYYPTTLCLSDSSNGYSHAQGHYGLYILDTTQTFDNRYVYKNERLQNVEGNEWYILYYEEKDAWVINELIPGETIVRTTEGICREDVDTPDLCRNACWEFYENGSFEPYCSVSAKWMTSTDEVDCMGPEPSNDIIHYTKEINLCFDDGVTVDWDNQYSGKWYLHETDTYGGRAYWYTINEDLSIPGQAAVAYYMFYDPYWRYWVIDRVLGRSETNGWHYLHYYCLRWDEFEPFNCTDWYSSLSHTLTSMSMKRDCTSLPPTTAPTMAPTINCDARKTWIYAETDQYIYSAETLTSMYTNFAPYVYDTFGKSELVIFEDNLEMTGHESNPCDYYTWKMYPNFYENKVVMIKYNSEFRKVCDNVQLWTLNLEKYTNGKIKAVLIGNEVDHDHVYPLAGTDSLSEPSVPTRMISQFASTGIEEAVEQGENVYITFGCFEDEHGIDYPNIICLVDTSVMGKHVYLDGEYQRQADIVKNEHPVWLKDHFDGLWTRIYMWLDVERGNGESWKWVIGTDYNNMHTIIAKCDVDIDNWAINHPGSVGCDGNWVINGQLETSIITSDTICELGDNYVCVDSAEGGLFDMYFDGKYRQIHSGVPLWLLQDSFLDAYLTIGQINFPPMFSNEYSFIFALNQTQTFAFCPLGQEEPSREVALSPQNCNKNWYKMEILPTGYTWVEDFAFDIDSCAHEALETPAPKYVQYPQILCLNDETNAYSQNQVLYGVYVLDTSRTYDGKFVYYNQRLAGGDAHEWYILWYEEKDAWVINEMIPDTTVVREHEGICREEVFSPEMCTNECWEFSNSLGQYTSDCNVRVTTVNSLSESDCMKLPTNNMMNDYIDSIVLGFDDGMTETSDNVYSGVWRLSRVTYNGRAYWYKYYTTMADKTHSHDNIEYYMFYDETWRAWVIDRALPTEGSSNKQSWHLYCLRWYEFQPFKCDVWYTNTVGFTMKMDATYQSAPIMSTTQASAATTARQTSQAPQTSRHSTTTVNGRPKLKKEEFNLLPWIVCSIAAATLCVGVLFAVCFCKKNKKKRFEFRDVSEDGVFQTVYGVSANPEDEDINLNMIQMGKVDKYDMGTLGNATGTGTKGKGEKIAMRDSDDEDIISHHIIDDNEGTHPITGHDNNPNQWVQFEE